MVAASGTESAKLESEQSSKAMKDKAILASIIHSKSITSRVCLMSPTPVKENEVTQN